MTRIDIIGNICDQLGFTKNEASDHLESVFSIMKQTLASGEDLKISGFGKFHLKQKKDRRGRNPNTGEAITIEARKVLVYRASPVLKEKINEQK